MTDCDTALESGVIVSLYSDNQLMGKILWGTILKDYKGRFEQGDYVCTSTIESEDGDHIRTLNTIYKLMALVSRIDLPIAAIIQLRAGVDPRMIQMAEKVLTH